jgi:hypothetical protein
MNRVCFLDIDGPIISMGCYGVTPQASMLRTCMNQNAIGYLNMFLKLSGASLVTNSSHNYHEIKEPDFETGKFRDLKTDLIRFGVQKDAFHADWRTTFPECGHFSGGSMNRMIAIEQWIAKNGDHEWCCFDDEIFIKDKRLIPIDFDHGITRDAVHRACGVFGIDSFPLAW